MGNSALRQRIRGYEDAYRYKLTKRTPVIIRVDGRAFHNLTRKAEKPFDKDFIEAMDQVAIALFSQISGAQIAYVQSDEVTVFVRNYNRYKTSPWFDNTLQKVCSISACIASNAFNAHYGTTNEMFDSRVFTCPREEVCNVFIDRQKDCEVNTILALGQSLIGKKKINGQSCESILKYLEDKQLLPYENNQIPQDLRYGRIVINKIFVTERQFIVKQPAPVFDQSRNTIDDLVWPNDEEGAYSKRAF